MKATTTGIEDKVDELLAVLDVDIEHMQESLSRLDGLRSLVIKRDDAALAKLLESMQAESDIYKNNESKRQLLRKELAAVLGCRPGEMTLSRLEDKLSGETKVQVVEKKAELKTLARKLKTEHLSTTALLLDCARLNTLLLRNVFDLGKQEIITYSPDGSKKRQTSTAFVDMQF